MTIRLGDLLFDHVSYDVEGDVLYLSVGEPQAAAETFGTPEGHAVRFDATGAVIGITLVNAKWLAERDGRVRVTVPTRIDAPAADIAAAFAAS